MISKSLRQALRELEKRENFNAVQIRESKKTIRRDLKCRQQKHPANGASSHQHEIFQLGMQPAEEETQCIILLHVLCDQML